MLTTPAAVARNNQMNENEIDTCLHGGGGVGVESNACVQVAKTSVGRNHKNTVD